MSLNESVHLSLLYCLDRPYLNQTLGGVAFVHYRIVVDILLCVSIIVVNIGLIFAIYKYRRKHRGTSRIYNSGTSMKFVQTLAFSDVLVAVTIPIYLIPHYLCDVNDFMRGVEYLCTLKYGANAFSSMMSNLSLMNIAIDRYIAIQYTLQYRSIMTHRVCHLMIAGQVVLSLVTSSVLYFWNYWKKDSYCDFEDIVPAVYVLSLAIVCHGIILVMVVGVHYKMHRKAAESSSRRNIIELGVLSRETKKNIKSAKVLMLVAGVYVICWTPYSIFLMIRILQIYNSPLIDFFYQFTFSLSMANSLLNPFIYAWKNSEIQNALIWTITRRSSTTSS